MVIVSENECCSIHLWITTIYWVTEEGLLSQGKSCGWVSEQSDWSELSISRLQHWRVDQHWTFSLPLWRVCVDIPAPTTDVLNRLRSVPGTSNSTVSRWETLAGPRRDVDLVQYAVSIPHALDRTRCFHVIRYYTQIL